MRNPDHLTILGALHTNGLCTAKALQAATGKSQATVSRLLAELSDEVLPLGQGRARSYGLGLPIRGLPAQQPLYLVDENGRYQQHGQLSLLSGGALHTTLGGHSWVTRNTLPWALAPLRAQGFLGRLLAQRLQAADMLPDPERWALPAVLYAALHTHDAPGALILGEPSSTPPSAWLPDALTQSDALAAELDRRSADVARTLPAGSSAGGEQPKLLAQLADGSHVLVKFTPPRGTPFGERWHELLLAEALALATLQAHGMRCADTGLLHSPTRTYLLSWRFDRIGAHGRRHVVAIGAVHENLLSDSYQHWAHSGHQLRSRQQLSLADAQQIETALHFGRLIGNTDMHSGNLSLFVELGTWKRPRFNLAPLYDMLPMRWRPDAAMGAPDYSPFDLHPLSVQSPARPVAQAFWRAMADDGRFSVAMRTVAEAMAERLNG
jgi:HipA-like C-terminal domain